MPLLWGHFHEFQVHQEHFDSSEFKTTALGSPSVCDPNNQFNQQQTLKGKTARRRNFKNVENQIGLESEKKQRFDVNLANWRWRSETGAAHLSKCRFLWRLCFWRKKIIWFDETSFEIITMYVNIEIPCADASQDDLWERTKAAVSKWTTIVWCQQFLDSQSAALRRQKRWIGRGA